MTKISTDTAPSDKQVDTEQFDSPTAATYAVLAECWQEPTNRLVEVVENGELTPIVGDLDSVSLSDLRAEYTRLFVGPGLPQCPPYESVYRDKSDGDGFDPVVGPATTAVARWYQAFDIELSSGHSDLPDHIMTELEFAAYLADQGLNERCEQFLDEHLRAWTDEFLMAVETETRRPFYASLARSTRELL